MQKGGMDREVRRKAIGQMLKSADSALGERLRKLKAPPPPEAKEEKQEEEVTADDERRLMALYEETQAAKE